MQVFEKQIAVKIVVGGRVEYQWQEIIKDLKNCYESLSMFNINFK